jgi:electron transport complex protein RnfC
MNSLAQSLNIKESPCIRCDECALVCPVNLLPQQLHWYSLDFNEERLNDYSLFACTECDECTSVCPSHIPLLSEFRQAKDDILSKRNKRIKADENKQRYLDKLARKAKQEEEKVKSRMKKIEKDKESDLKKKQDAIAAAVNRVKQKRQNKTS